MRVKWTTLHIIIPAIAATVLIKTCDLAATTRTSADLTLDNSALLRECNMTNETAYCVPIRSCETMLYTLRPAAIRARRCGPPKDNLSNPLVCCERSIIGVEVSTTQEAATSRPSKVQAQPVKEISEEEILYTTTTPASRNTPQQPPQSYDECGIQDPDIEMRVVGGNPASRKEFPWLGRLLRRDSQGDLIFSCSGSLISSKVVLTAAHCLVANSLVAVGELYAVSLGEHETTCRMDATECLLNKRTIIVSNFTVHPRYNKNSKNHDNDIGLIFLRDAVKFTSFIAPICLLEDGTEATQYYIAGWGRTETGTVSGVKLKIAIPPFAWSQCAERYNKTRVKLTRRQMCAGGVEGMDACQGDSGGPLMVQNGVKWYAAGIVSLGMGCGRKGWPGIYVYVPNYITWINKTIKQRGL